MRTGKRGHDVAAILMVIIHERRGIQEHYAGLAVLTRHLVRAAEPVAS